MSKSLNIQTNDFDSWFDSVNLNMEFWESPVRAARFGYEAGQQSKQKEVDVLQKRIRELELINFDSELHFDAAKEHIDLLQKRIDDALEKCYTGIRKQGGEYYLELIEGILKGGTND